MSKLRVFLVISLVVLGVFLVCAFLIPMTRSEPTYTEVSRESLLRTQDGWILQYDIFNLESEDHNYTFNVSVGGSPSTLTISIQGEQSYTYIKHINRDMISSEKGQVSINVYEEGQDTPIEQGTYYLS